MQNHILLNQNGKIERSFRTIKDNFVNCSDWNSFTSLEDLNAKYTVYLEDSYNNCVHSSIETTPKKRYMQDYEIFKFLPKETIDIMFLYTQKRKVSTDATINLNSIKFEKKKKYIKQQIQVKYPPDNLNIAYIYDEFGNLKHEIYPVDKIANSKVKRSELSFSDMIGDE